MGGGVRNQKHAVMKTEAAVRMKADALETARCLDGKANKLDRMILRG